MDSKLHAVCDGKVRPLIMLLSEGQMSDYKGAALMIDACPKAKALLADRGYDADWFRHAPAERGITACIPSKTTAKCPSRTTRPSTASVTRSRTCSANSRTGAASTRATTAAPTRWLRRPSGHVRHLHRSNRRFLAATMSPEPSATCVLGKASLRGQSREPLPSNGKPWSRR